MEEKNGIRDLGSELHSENHKNCKLINCSQFNLVFLVDVVAYCGAVAC